MRSLHVLGVVVLAGALLGGASSVVWPVGAAAQTVAAPMAVAEVRDATGRLLANATLREAPDQVLINLTFPDRAALIGVHAIQIHETGRCDPPDFSSAGGIFNPFGKQHGLRNSAGPMAGDVPSLSIGPTGVAGYNTSAPLAKLSPGPASLLRQGGTALVILAQPDDDQTQPEGNAGARIACGVIVVASPPGTANSALAGRANGDPDLPTALLIGALGAALIAAGVVLRQSRAALR